jgi:hypothetical protein
MHENNLTETFTASIVLLLIRTFNCIGFLADRIAALMLDLSSENLLKKVHGNVVLRSVFHTLAYADIFDYPLTAPEVYRYLTSLKSSPEEVNHALTDKTLFAQVGDYFVLRGREEIVETRKRRAEIADGLWPKAVRYGRIIASLPFVRMVAVTGSLAMKNTDEGNDVDYMIVTAPNHLWTCRALSLLIARFARLEGVRLCPNYLVTTNAMDLKERSLYVAHEFAQMIPLSGMEVYRELRRLNPWARDYLPNALNEPEMPQGMQPTSNFFIFQKVLETFLSLPIGRWLEKWEMDRKIARLTREQSSSFESYFSVDVCKGHIDRHGQKTENVLIKRLQAFPQPNLPSQHDETRWERIPFLPLGAPFGDDMGRGEEK